ncbi:hypothetical protein A2955_03125 [Candidatus Woesebacteria bacterium RIFCSPLOWO2_01_FULL_37_19]|uniref:Uncharacterized protein n=1 Tax=Candidatus Woesebacteria bacterium RIFCSPLOWO2_01_FULL_37_19 TaxID=1802514 RepID=A0A1F8AYW4_9BACT|nr:MAG: hypothetical protein A2955_03125 [Candidatus Woesebacteria bacterium RIFCSPLOWO2_01_FULL_37_19]
MFGLIELKRLDSSDLQLTIGSFGFKALLINIAVFILEQAPSMPIFKNQFPELGPWKNLGQTIGWTPIGVVNAFNSLFEELYWSLHRLIEMNSLEGFNPKELGFLREGILAYESWATKRWGPNWKRNLGIIDSEWKVVLNAINQPTAS